MKKKMMFIFGIAFMVICNMSSVLAVNTNGLEVYFLPVGKADSIVIVCEGKVALIDGGKTTSPGSNFKTGDINGYKVTKKFLKNTLGINKIDYLIGTHTHPDHVGAWQDLVKDFQVGHVYVSQYACFEEKYQQRIGSLFPSNKITKLKAGDVVSIGGAQLKVLAPWNGINMTSKIMKNHSELENTYSMITKLTYKNHSFLFMADALQSSESKYAREGAVKTGRAMSTWLRLKYKSELAVDVVKLPHHGVNRVSENLLNQILPEGVNKKQYIVVTCDATQAKALKKGQFNSEKYKWITTQLMKLRPAAKFLYPSLQESYVMFKSDGTNLTCTKK